jgi:hypothetical protein
LGLLENLQDITHLLVERGDFGKAQPEILRIFRVSIQCFCRINLFASNGLGSQAT